MPMSHLPDCDGKPCTCCAVRKTTPTRTRLTFLAVLCLPALSLVAGWWKNPMSWV